MKKYNFIKEVILNHNDLVRMSDRVRSEIIKFYQRHSGNPELVVITILDGGRNFSRSLFSVGYIPKNFKIEHFTLSAKSYGSEVDSSGKVMIGMGSSEEEKKMFDAIKGKSVLIVDDIYDSGRTLDAVVRLVSDQHALSVECCVMIQRVLKRHREVDIRPSFIGHFVHMPDFLVGAGFDYEGKYRDLPYIGTVKPNFKEKHREEHICNKCGELCTSPEELVTCNREDGAGSYGLLNAVARGHYFSPILEDCTAYKFDLCEPCLKKIFDGFKIPTEKREYDIWTGEVYG